MSFGAAALVAAVGSALSANKKAKRYEYNLACVYSENMQSLNESVGNINMQLQKSVYATSPTQLGKIAVNLSKESVTALDAIAALPADSESTNTVKKFLSQVGDYSFYLANLSVNGGEITDEERENLKKLSEIAKKIDSAVISVGADMDDIKSWNNEIENELPKNFARSISYGGENFKDYPTLIYDGPFSDHILKKESKLLSRSKPITLNEALDIAAGALQTSSSKLHYAGEEQSKTSAYCFASKNSYIAVTKNGGYVLYFRKTESYKTKKITAEKAVQIAKEYIEKQRDKLGSFKTSYYFCDEGVCTVNFAYKQGNTVCYTDLIKIGVSLDSGNVVLMESRGYIMNHTSRSMVAPTNTFEKAKAAVAKNLTVKDCSLALIPTDGGGEVHCFEVLCEGDNKQEVLVYLNVVSLKEEQILILLKSDGGVLAK